MQSIFRLPWCSDPIAPKMSESAGLEKMRPAPMVEIPVLQKLKRKRTNSSDISPLRAHENKKPRPEGCESQLQHVSTLDSKPENPASQTPGAAPASHNAAPSSLERTPSNISPPSSTNTDKTLQNLPIKARDESTDVLMSEPQMSASNDASCLTPLQQVIENEFNMQILMKHNELRLIEQELAKCQVALEQLRRCEIRPYPGSDRPSEAVSAGTGPSVLPPPGFTRPSHPAPYGVTDGPYSKHYRQWLLQDMQFEPISLQSLQSEAAVRSTRNSGLARRSIHQSFTFPGKSAERIPSTPSFPAPPPKDRNQPNVLRRSTDGQLVKLICNNCQRGNFSSIQGFLNHCRIAHKVDYKSHDAAAIDCGQPLDESEAASLPVETQHTPAPKPTPSRAPPTVVDSSRNLIHPFNTSIGTSLALDNARQPTAVRQPARSLSSAVSAPGQQSFSPAAQLPRLSAHFLKHQFGGDLAKAVADAKQPIDLGVEDDLPSPDIVPSPLGPQPGSRTLNGGRKGTLGINSASTPRPSSRKGFRQPAEQSKARPAPLAPSLGNSMAAKQDNSEILDSPDSHVHSLDLSPHTTDGNPGLVSDHEDDDHGSASESEDGPAPHPHPSRQLPVSGSRTTCADSMDLDVAVEGDEIDEDGVIIRRNSLSADDHVRDATGKFGNPVKRAM